ASRPGKDMEAGVACMFYGRTDYGIAHVGGNNPWSAQRRLEVAVLQKVRTNISDRSPDQDDVVDIDISGGIEEQHVGSQVSNIRISLNGAGKGDASPSRTAGPVTYARVVLGGVDELKGRAAPVCRCRP